MLSPVLITFKTCHIIKLHNHSITLQQYKEFILNYTWQLLYEVNTVISYTIYE